jgi:hypothetical protein
MKWLRVLDDAGPPQSLVIERYSKINWRNSAAESWTGIGVMAGFTGAVGMIELSHMKKAESAS